MEHRELLSGVVRLHILHHAVEGELYGQRTIGELAGHGYRVSRGTPCPILRAMEARGHLVSEQRQVGRTIRRLHRATPIGVGAMSVARAKARELFGEIVADARP